MELNEAKEILKENGYIVEGAYKDIIHSKLKEIRTVQKADEDEDIAANKLANKVIKKIYNELTEFCSDFNDEIVDEKIGLTDITSDVSSWFEFTVKNIEDKETIEVNVLGENPNEIKIIISINNRRYPPFIERNIIVKKLNEKLPEILDSIMDYITVNWN